MLIVDLDLTSTYPQLSTARKSYNLSVMSSTSSRKGWHSLPREIRDHIYEDILECQIAPPSTPDFVGKRREVGFHPGSQSNYRSLHYQPDSHSNSLALLLSCRQINGEISEFIAWKNRENASSSLTYYLDCMVQGYKAWPTWICLPAVSRRVANLEVTFRIFQDADVFEDSCHIYGKTLKFVTPLLQILNHLFHHGPHFFQQERSSRSMSVTTITLKIIFPDAVTPCEAHGFDYFNLYVRKTHEELHRVERQGFLFGHVDKIVCLSAFYEGDEVLHIQAHPQDQLANGAPVWSAVWGPNPPLRYFQ